MVFLLKHAITEVDMTAPLAQQVSTYEITNNSFAGINKQPAHSWLRKSDKRREKKTQKNTRKS